MHIWREVRFLWPHYVVEVEVELSYAYKCGRVFALTHDPCLNSLMFAVANVSEGL